VILRAKPDLERWALAANLILILFFLPFGFLGWRWRVFLNNEHNWWPEILIGIFGIIVFSIPYHGRKNRPAVDAPLMGGWLRS
jgi:phosphoglycerol transferase MdoB-like AlkP superfamily enzyme